MLFLLFEVYLRLFDAFITDLRHCVGDILVKLLLDGHFEPAGLVFVEGVIEVLVKLFSMDNAHALLALGRAKSQEAEDSRMEKAKE